MNDIDAAPGVFKLPAPVEFEFAMSPSQARAWARLFAQLSGQPARDVRRMAPSRVCNAAYRRRQRNRAKRRRR